MKRASVLLARFCYVVFYCLNLVGAKSSDSNASDKEIRHGRESISRCRITSAQSSGCSGGIESSTNSGVERDITGLDGRSESDDVTKRGVKWIVTNFEV